ncbi:unnamed protein product [Bursaphelenchus okinawaensis]|uniref:U3 small nucleolar RNA-associated protein 15 homolog n=1 Tax=Bursaphelenchus okinawaensis TaxID=465554 RepID=A0A811JT95_9BILA|nr:unnamed protein product [Bursaphelenchus okinawaensis]CAG9081966.1 unnamed protein product [Bursaphelenchus okinawaensis]
MVKPLQPVTDVEFRTSDDIEYWSRMKELAVFQEPGVISSVAFSPNKPYHLAVANSNRVSLFDTSIAQPVWFQSRFRSNVFGLKFREDGQLLGMGTLDGYVHFFDVTKNELPSRHPLRVFKAHDSEVRCIEFQTKSQNCVTLGDDSNIKVWDLALSNHTEPLITISGAHSDRIRAAVTSHNNTDVVVSGSYDHTLKLWDTRQENKQCSIQMNHDAPVEKVLLTSNDRLLISAGGNCVKFWDLAAGGRLIQTLENHNRTVTSLAMSQDKKYLLSGGLDRRVHVFCVDQGTYSLVSTIPTAAPVLSMDLAKSGDCLAFGMNNLLSIQRRQPKAKIPKALKKNVVGTGKALKLKSTVIQHREGNAEMRRADVTAKHIEQVHLGRLDVLLRSCQFRKVVDQVMQHKKLREEQPELVVAALNQLKIRGVLPTALAGRQGPQLRQILGFVSTHFFKPSFSEVLMDVANVIFNVYIGEELSRNEMSAMRDLRNQIKAEIACQQSMLRVCGIMESLWNTEEHTQSEENDEVFGEMVSLFPKAIEDEENMEEVLSSEDEEDEALKARKKQKKGALSCGFRNDFVFVDDDKKGDVDHYDGIKPYLKKTVAISLQDKIDEERKRLKLNEKVVLGGTVVDEEGVIQGEDDDGLVQELVETSDKIREKKVKGTVQQKDFFDGLSEDLTNVSEAMTFYDMKLSRKVLKAVMELGYTQPTPIQAACIPVALAGKDICACSATGTGKTAAFMLPILERLLYKPKGQHSTTRVLVLVPTRELAIQVFQVSRKLAQFTNVEICLCAGMLLWCF